MTIEDTFAKICKDQNISPQGDYAEDIIDNCRACYEAGAASRDAEVVSLTNQRDYEYVRAENAEQERDQLRAELSALKETKTGVC